MSDFQPDNLLDVAQFDKKTALTEKIVSIAVNALIVVMALLLIMYVAVEPLNISGASMEPGIHHGDEIVINKFYFNPKRGDVIVIKSDKTTERIIKRVIAVEDDKIGFAKSKSGDKDVIFLYLDTGDGNGFVRVNEPYINGFMTESNGEIFKEFPVADSYDEMLRDSSYVIVGKNRFVALGDNRNISRDSRYYGQFSCSFFSSDIVGKKIADIEEGSFLDRFFSFFFHKSDTVNNKQQGEF